MGDPGKGVPVGSIYHGKSKFETIEGYTVSYVPICTYVYRVIEVNKIESLNLPEYCKHRYSNEHNDNTFHIISMHD
jgi:hypothetical protein